MKRSLRYVAVFVLSGAGVALFQGTRKVGARTDGTTLVPTGQVILSAGHRIQIPNSRPIDSAMNADQSLLYVKDNRGFFVLNTATNQVAREISISGGTSLSGIEVHPGGDIFISDAASGIHRYRRNGQQFEFVSKATCPTPAVGGSAYPCGIAFSADGNQMMAAASRSNTLVVFNLQTNQVVRSINTDICPYEVILSPDGQSVWVSCWGGPRPATGDRVQKSAGTDVKVDERGVAAYASVLQIRLSDGTIQKRIKTGLQPTKMAFSPDGSILYVCAANGDSVQGIQTSTGFISQNIPTKLDPALPFGSMPNALAVSEDGQRLYVANGGTNSVAVIGTGSSPELLGHIPVAWFPTSVDIRGQELWISSAKGLGSRILRTDQSYGVTGFLGAVDRVTIPNSKRLADLTQQAKTASNSSTAVAAMKRNTLTDRQAVPIPAKLGDPSTIEHVVYILKENRTYDQVFGDLPQGDGQPNLCVFPRTVTPNHHKIAETYVLLDNFYCNGVLSADGHAWSMEGNATAYFERSFGGWTRSYPFGDDPLAVSTSGFIWDHVLGAGLSFKNFGEFDYASPQPSGSWTQIYNAWLAGQSTYSYNMNIGVERLRNYSVPGFPGWNMGIPDQVRASKFLSELSQMKTMPNLTIIYLPQDHTSGGSAGQPTPRACVADNDLATGKIIDALSRTPFWKKMAVFVTEDDPQAGYDHVDGHRSICLVASPYAKRGAVVSQFYNQTSILHTICRILGLPPINAMVAQSPIMFECFQKTPNFTPFGFLPNQVQLNEMNGNRPDPAIVKAGLADVKFDLSRPDQIDEDQFNRVVWHSVMGSKKYPSEWAGAHGKGLKAKGLALGGEVDDD